MTTIGVNDRSGRDGRGSCGKSAFKLDEELESCGGGDVNSNCLVRSAGHSVFVLRFWKAAGFWLGAKELIDNHQK